MRSPRPTRPLDEMAIEFVVNGTRLRLGSTEDEVEAVRRMAERGVTVDDAALRLGVSRDTVLKRARVTGTKFTSAVLPVHWTADYVAAQPRRRHR